MTDFQPDSESSESPDFAKSSVPKSNNVWKWVALGCGGVFFLFVLLIASAMFFAFRQLNFSMDPEAVEEEARTVFDYEIPGGSQGLLTMNMFGVEIIQVTDKNQPPDVLLMVGTLPPAFQTEQAQEQMIESFEESFSGQEQFETQNQRIEDRQLCGETVQVLIQDGTASTGQSATEPATTYSTIVTYDGKSRFAWLLANGDSSSQLAEQVFSSLECR